LKQFVQDRGPVLEDVFPGVVRIGSELVLVFQGEELLDGDVLFSLLPLLELLFFLFWRETLFNRHFITFKIDGGN